MDLTIIDENAIASKIYEIRGVKCMLDSDLSKLYQVETKNINKAMARNPDKFPDDFVFQLTQNEAEDCLRFQTGTLKRGHHLKYLPYAYTEHGVMQLSNVLRSKIANEISVKIIRVFVHLRTQVFTNSDFIALKEQVRRIESDNIVDKKLLHDKMSQISRELNRMSSVLNDFQNSTCFLKRPEDFDDPKQEMN